MIGFIDTFTGKPVKGSEAKAKLLRGVQLTCYAEDCIVAFKPDLESGLCHIAALERLDLEVDRGAVSLQVAGYLCDLLDRDTDDPYPDGVEEFFKDFSVRFIP